MRRLVLIGATAAIVGFGCPATSAPGARPGTVSTVRTTGSPGGGNGAPAAAAGQPARLTPPEQIAPERRVWAYLDGQRRAMDIDQARSLGFTIVDLSDDWVPYIFWSQTPGQEDFKPNRYQEDYVALANDRINVDGARLRRGKHNYLEVWGIPPSLSVLRRRFLEEEQKPCFSKLDRELFSDYHGPIKIVDPKGSERLRRRYISARAAFVKVRRKTHKSLEQLLEHPRYKRVARNYQRLHWQYHALLAMPKRLRCEGLLKRRTKPGVVDWTVRKALKRFERKHNIYGWGMIFGKTAAALGRLPRENNYEALKRVITERVVSAAGILEDGSSHAHYRGADGQKKRVRNLVAEFADVAIEQMGLTDADKALAFIKAHSEQDFKRMFVALKLPKVPEYYSDHVELQVIIDRGDVWYDLPFDLETGKRKPQPRRHLPKFKLYVKYGDQTFPIVRWRTTIGGWQKERRGEQEYYKYKISDVGKRIWKNIVAGPVWVPPRKTPGRELVRRGVVRGRSQPVVRQSTFGPGYASAYGLVAAYHVTKHGRDNQVRTHGTVNYMSVRRGFSHGCHRLYNYRAVRLFSWILRHRTFKRQGQVRLHYEHRFEHRGQEFQINIHTRGYYYEMTPPVEVNVLEGDIRGKLKEPVEEYIKKPTTIYQEDLDHLRKKRNKSGAPRKKSDNPMRQQQPL